jgi:hypothetical protein
MLLIFKKLNCYNNIAKRIIKIQVHTDKINSPKMKRSTDSEIRSEGSEDLLKLLSNFRIQQNKDEYSVD